MVARCCSGGRSGSAFLPENSGLRSSFGISVMGEVSAVPTPWESIFFTLASSSNTGMVLNDVFFLVLWYMFFAGFRRVGGWGLHDVALLLGLIMLVVGIAGFAALKVRDPAAAAQAGTYAEDLPAESEV